jgi:glutaredoxin
MKKLVFVIAIVAGIYHFKHDLFSASAHYFPGNSSGDVVVFTFPECGTFCTDALRLLKEKNVAFENIDVKASQENEDKWRKMGGGDTFPVIHFGGKIIQGYYRTPLTHELARVYGMEMLDGPQRRVVEQQLATYGNDTIVMYSTSWCPYCAKARKFFARKGLKYVEIDVEKSSEGAQYYRTLEGTGYPLIYAGINRFTGFSPRIEKDIASAL